jgi:hypothetical protein
VDQCGVSHIPYDLSILLTCFLLSEKERAFFAEEFAQQKEAEQERRIKQAEKDAKKETRKKKVTLLSQRY